MSVLTIKMQTDEREYDVKLTDGRCAESLRNILPVRSEFYMSNHLCYGELPVRLDASDAEKTSSLHKGGVYYADRLQALAVCMKENIQMGGIGLILIGEIEDMEHFPEKDSRFTLCEKETL